MRILPIVAALLAACSPTSNLTDAVATDNDGPPDISGGNLPGLTSRPDNIGCEAPSDRGIGSPIDLSLETMFDGEAFSYSTQLIQSPKDSELFWLLQRGADWLEDELGKVKRIKISATGEPPIIKTALNISDRVLTANHAGMLGMALHPDFLANGEMFLYYTGPGAEPFKVYLSRFTLDPEDSRDFLPESEEILLSFDSPSVYLQGGGLAFGPDGYLYVGVGDGGIHTDALAQDPNDLHGAILRIDVDAEGAPYASPTDNPYAEHGVSPGEGLPEIYAMGFRHPWRLSFDSFTGNLWVADVGKDTWEEVNVVNNGLNYGWPQLEGYDCYTVGCSPDGFEEPMVTHLAADLGGDATAIIGGAVYRGEAIPELNGIYLYGDFNGSVWGLFTDSVGNPSPELLLTNLDGLRSFSTGTDGEMYIVADQIHKIIPGSVRDYEMPLQLSEVGCRREDVLETREGLIPYTIAVPAHEGEVEASRWFAIPDETTIVIDTDGVWDFPIGAILMEDLTESGIPFETRILARHADGDWGAYRYVWNADHTDATLLIGDQTIQVAGSDRYLDNPGSCLACHTLDAGRVLGATSGQISGSVFYPQSGRFGDQFESLSDVGLITGNIIDPGPWPAPGGTTGTAEDQARAWMHVNCAHCHRDETGLNLQRESTWDPCTSASIVAGDPLDSDLYGRIASGDMPSAGYPGVDNAGLAAVEAWITDLTCP